MPSRRKAVAGRSLVTIVAVTAALIAGPAVAAQAATGVHYAALGDSYSSGYGAPPFDPASGSCARSPLGYPTLFAQQRHAASFDFTACSGATTADVRSTQLAPLDANTDLVTITIGGNDVGFATVLGACTVATRDADCLAAVDRSELATLTVLPLQLSRTYAAIRNAAPHARVVVLGYPRLFEKTTDCADPFAPDRVRRVKLDQGADLLDSVTAAVAQGFGFTFADVRGSFAGHGLCATDSWINGPEAPASVGPYHPTATGYAHGYLPPLLAATSDREQAPLR